MDKRNKKAEFCAVGVIFLKENIQSHSSLKFNGN